MAWTPFTGTDNEWDDLLLKLNCGSPFALSNWGRYKRDQSWNPTRLTVNRDGVPGAAALVLLKQVFGLITIAWVPGGIAGGIAHPSESIIRAISSISRTPFIYCRVAFHRPDSYELSGALEKSGWNRCARFIGAQETFQISRAEHGIAHRPRLSSNWSRNLERGFKRNADVTVNESPSATEIHGLFEQMANFKQEMGPEGIPSVESLASLIRSMRSRMVVVESRNPSGNLNAVRAAYIVGSSAWDALAAASPEARQNYSSYVCAWKLLEELERKGITTFDLAGVDAVQNVGVYNFKKGFGGTLLKYLGEWDFSRPKFIRIIVGRVVSRLL